ncbi:MAG: hypothetical protein CME70_14705 [Halobacteriovorax sp.]|nr:hypothetical protein [Halobacteriovorax sp.]|tara:strand:- start:189598 stop:190602 length:1005 start_codon:yes stop_codon:yes gene_type:complete
MTLGIIGEVKLKQVNSSQLKWDPTGHPLWFNGLEQDLYLVIGHDEVRHFEISFQKHLVSGGASKAIQYGHIKSDEGRSHELSRIVHYQKDVPSEIIQNSIEIVESCLDLEPKIKFGIISYLKGFSFGTNPLRFDSSLTSYVPLEKRDLPTPKLKTHHIKKMLPKHLGLKVMAGLITLGSIVAYYSMEYSKGQEFLKMDERMSPSYIDKFVSRDGDLLTVDSQNRSILHRTAPYISSVNDEQYKAFVHLLIQYEMDPNQFDINGKTPFYYMIRNYLNPPKAVKSHTQYRDEMYLVIGQMSKLGLKSKIKKNQDDRSAWELAKEDIRLRELLQSRP